MVNPMYNVKYLLKTLQRRRINSLAFFKNGYIVIIILTNLGV